ncbi:NAD(P)-binding protein, partial [Candidatus Cyanaurora vandensis]
MTSGGAGRRYFLQGALFSLAAASLTLGSRADEYIEAIVIGSGFGGSVAALRLGEQGITTLVLERGRRWPTTTNAFCTYGNPDGRAAWLSPTTLVYTPHPIEVYTGVLDRFTAKGISVYR